MRRRVFSPRSKISSSRRRAKRAFSSPAVSSTTTSPRSARLSSKSSITTSKNFGVAGEKNSCRGVLYKLFADVEERVRRTFWRGGNHLKTQSFGTPAADRLKFWRKLTTEQKKKPPQVEGFIFLQVSVAQKMARKISAATRIVKRREKFFRRWSDKFQRFLLW